MICENPSPVKKTRKTAKGKEDAQVRDSDRQHGNATTVQDRVLFRLYGLLQQMTITGRRNAISTYFSESQKLVLENYSL